MTRNRLWTAAVLAFVPAITAPLSAQFQTPLPPALDAITTCAIKIEQEVRKAGEAGKDTTPVRTRDPCRLSDAFHIDNLRDTIRRSLFDTTRVSPIDAAHLRRWVVRRPTVLRSDRELRALYGDKAISVFSSFAGLLGEETLYLSSSVLRGVIGRFHFDFSFAQVVSAKEDTAGTTALTRAELRDATSRVMRLVNNGGSGTARMLMPLFAGGGTVTQRAAAVYANAGVLGPLSRSDSLSGTLGVAADLLMTHAIRDPTTYALVGDIMLGARTGYQYVSERRAIAPTDRGQSLAFLQIAAGVRQGATTRLAVLYTLVNGEYQDFIPALLVSVQTSGF